MHEVATSRRDAMRALAMIPAIITAPIAMAAPNPRAQWGGLVTQYRRDTAALNNHPYGSTCPSHPDYEALDAEHDQYLCRAARSLDAVMEYPVIDNRMLAEKMEIMVAEFGGDNFVSSIRDDARRLAKGA